MRRKDFIKLIGAHSGNADYLPVACLLTSGYACAGYYNSALNEEFEDACVLVNARLVDVRDNPKVGERAAIQDFNHFIEEIVTGIVQAGDGDPDAFLSPGDQYGRSIPLTALSYTEISVVYPVSHIGTLMRRVEEDEQKIPTFLDFERKSIVLKILKTKLW